MNLYSFPFRRCDAQGCGHYGAPRGGRIHRGIDLTCESKTPVGAPVGGVVTKVGWPYIGNFDIRYIQVTCEDYRYRVFYVSPTVTVGDTVEIGDVIGTAQSLKHLYPGITDHVHLEVKDPDGAFVDPTPLLQVMRSLYCIGLRLP